MVRGMLSWSPTLWGVPSLVPCLSSGSSPPSPTECRDGLVPAVVILDPLEDTPAGIGMFGWREPQRAPGVTVRYTLARADCRNMSRCRLHVFPPDEPAQEDQQLRDAFEEWFTRSDATVQATSEEWVSEPFEDTAENLDRVDAFETQCREIYPEADILRTRQRRDAMDGRADEYDYEIALMLTVTHSLV